MVPPKSYAEIVQGARGAPPPPPRRAPPLPVLPPSTSSSSVVDEEPAPTPTPTQPEVGSRPRSYASALRGTNSPPLPPPPPPPPTVAPAAAAATTMSPPRSPSPPPPSPDLETVISIDLPAVPAPAPSPSPAPSSAPTTAPYAHLWGDQETFDLVVTAGRAAWIVHRHVLVHMSEWMEEYLPPPCPDGGPADWNLDPVAWGPGRLEAIFGFMYFEGKWKRHPLVALRYHFPGGHYDPTNPASMEPILDNVAHYVCGAAVLCRPMMDEAVRRIEVARPEIVDKLPIIQQDSRMLDKFEDGLRRALINLYAEPNQPLLRPLRIVCGKLIADCFPVILQNPAWSTKYQRLWGIQRVRVVADHKWLYQAGLIEKNSVIMHGFEDMSILWQNYRDQGWQPAIDIMFPENLVDTLPLPPPAPAAQNKRKKTRAVPIVSADGTVTARPGSTMPRGRGGRGRGRGAPTGLVEPAPQPARGQGKQKQKQETETQASEAEPAEQGASSSTSQVTQDTSSTATTEAGPSSAAAQDVPVTAEGAARRAYWNNIINQYDQEIMWVNMQPPSTERARRSPSPARPSSSSSALSARAEPFQPGDSSLHSAAGSSYYTEDTSTTLPPMVDRATSDAYLDDPVRQAELYGSRDDEPPRTRDKGKGKEVAGSTATPGSSSKQSEDVTTTEGESSSQQEATEQIATDLMSVDLNKKDNDDDTRPPGPSPSETHDEDGP